MDGNVLVTETDLNHGVRRLEIFMGRQAITIIKWVTGILIAQGTLVVALIQYFK
jgi:hypothetical protein